jgi:diaminopimelate decarboxylase
MCETNRKGWEMENIPETLMKVLPVSSQFNAHGYCLGGFDVVTLARTWGTPLYLYDSATIESQVQALTGLLQQYPSPSEVTYAAKAYFSLGFAKKIANLGLGVDCVSLGELEIARKAGFDPAKVHLHGNNKSEQEIEAAIRWGVHCIVADSLSELALIEQVAARLGKRTPIWLRINPGVEVDTHPYLQTGEHASKFGFEVVTGDAEEGIHFAKRSQHLDLVGLHCHLGSQIFDGAPYIRAVEALLTVSAENGFTPLEFSPGGGWGVPYLPETCAPEPLLWTNSVLDAIFKGYQSRGWALPRLVLEPGRWLSARAGIAVYRVGAVKQASDGRRIIAVDGGMADNPRPALYQARYTAISVDRPGADRSIRSAVVGKYCESGDELISEVWLPPLSRGDLLAIPAAGAYQLSMSSNYNMAGRPSVLWLEDGKIEVIQERETPWDTGWWVSG